MVLASMLKIWEVRKIKGTFLPILLQREQKIASNNWEVRKIKGSRKRDTTVIKIQKLEGKQNFGSMSGWNSVDQDGRPIPDSTWSGHRQCPITCMKTIQLHWYEAKTASNRVKRDYILHVETRGDSQSNHRFYQSTFNEQFLWDFPITSDHLRST